MTSIDSARRIAEVIRRQATALRDGGSRRTGEVKASAAGDPGGLEAVIARRVRAIDANDPQRKRKAFRVFLESVLLSELGTSLVNDPAFYQLVDRVQEEMAADASLAEAMDEAASVLLAADRR